MDWFQVIVVIGLLGVVYLLIEIRMGLPKLLEQVMDMNKQVGEILLNIKQERNENRLRHPHRSYEGWDSESP